MKVTEGNYEVFENGYFIEIKDESNLGERDYLNISVFLSDKDLNTFHLSDKNRINSKVICEALNVNNVTGLTANDLLNQINLLNKQVELLINIEENNPCDPDITPRQVLAWKRYNSFMQENQDDFNQIQSL